MDAALRRWLEAHPYLEQFARFEHSIEEAVASAQPAPARAPSWGAYAADHARGVPLLRSEAAPDLTPAADALVRVADAIAAAGPLPEKLAADVGELGETLRRDPTEGARIVAWLVAGAPEADTPAQAGLARFLGWMVLRRALAPVVASYEAWRGKDDAWRRRDCPTCGALPTMAQLVGGEAGSQRLLSCGCCTTRWRFQRLGCPFCGNEVSDELPALEVEDEEGLRIDGCERCKGYLKTYTGTGEEGVYLVDWTTLHLDVLARERGFERHGTSLYDL